MKKLQGKELYRRLQEARNARKLLQASLQRNEMQQQIIENQKKIIANLERKMRLMKELFEKQRLRIEYLEKIVFGKSKKNKKNFDNDKGGPDSSVKKKDRKPRDPKTYQREIPKADQITNTLNYGLPCCPDCNGHLTNKKIVERYLEDIVLPNEKENRLKEVEHQIIESGWCEKCRRQKSAKPINGSKVFLGKNVRIMTVYLSVVMRLSYEQIRNIFRDIWHLSVSDGEIENILEEQGNRLTLEHDKIAKALLEEAAHYDETRWKTIFGLMGNYVWIKTGVKSTNTLFLFGRSRGKGNAEELCGGSQHVGITDDYPGYDGVFNIQALCWSHPHRNLRDLAESEAIEGKAKKNCQKTFKEFGQLYQELDEFKGTFEQRKAGKKKYIKRFRKIIREDLNDPSKLKTYKETLKKEEEKYFTFIDIEGIPMDNNRAERKLRHVVLKRKICLGSKTDKGAKMLEKLYSVVLTWWWKDPVNFISNYRHLLA